MEKEFVSYEQAVALKELGFNEKCCGYYLVRTLFITSVLVYDSQEIPVVKAPLKQQVFTWFREKYGLYSIIHCPIRNRANFTITGFDIDRVTYSDTLLISYEEAENACIDKLIKLAKEQVS
jgi:hypothetical protein